MGEKVLATDYKLDLFAEKNKKTYWDPVFTALRPIYDPSQLR